MFQDTLCIINNTIPLSVILLMIIWLMVDLKIPVQSSPVQSRFRSITLKTHWCHIVHLWKKCLLLLWQTWHFHEACRSVNNVDARKGVLRQVFHLSLSKGHDSADCRGQK